MPRLANSAIFHDPARAGENLRRVRPYLAAIPERKLLALLAQLPDPDGSLNLLERFTTVAPPAVIEYLSAHHAALHYLLAAFSYSGFLSEALLREPDWIVRLHGDPSLFRTRTQEELLAEYRTSATPLARVKRREYLRIMLRDVLELATLSEVTMELSALADAILEMALATADAELRARHGAPNSVFTVLSLGKLGGNELNYSSDIDLLFLYREAGETTGPPGTRITHKEYFSHLAGRIAGLITETSPEGRVFRVDLRLRPQGREGEAANSLEQAVDYYRKRARDWELQALVKARHSAGDAGLAREFLQEIQPLVYRGGGGFTALDSVLSARRRMSEELKRRRSRALDVKLGRGGIRDIEFLVQGLQRLHGGEDPWLRSSSTLFALQKLADKGWLGRHDHAALSRAYHFLRVVEHRLQLDRDVQTHRLPEKASELDLLARRAGIRGDGPALTAELTRRMAQVREIYERVTRVARTLPHPEHKREGFALQSPYPLTPESTFAQLLRAIESRYPGVHRSAEGSNELGRAALERFLMAMAGRPGGLGMLEESPELIERASVIFQESPYLSEMLIRSPEDVESLRDLPMLPSPAPELPLAIEEFGVPRDAIFEHVAASGSDTAEKMEVLRRHYRRRLLRIQARSILQSVPVFETLEITSRLAEQAIRAALRCAAGPGPHSFTVVALGRLGVREFDVASDADLAFFYSTSDADEGAEWIHAAERLIAMLSNHTSDGSLFAVDTRLRPRGREGELVESARFVDEYFRTRAEPWEAITYMKSRAVGGDLARGTALLTAVQDLIGERFGHGSKAAAQLLEMRKRLETTATVHNFLKMAPGGYYDIDFVLTFLRLRAAGVFYPSLNNLERLAVVDIAPASAAILREGAIFLRAVQHAQRLESGRSDTELPATGPRAAAVARLADRWIPESLRGRPLGESVESVMKRVREVFLQVFKT